MVALPEALTTVIDGAIEFVYSFQPLADKTLVLGKATPESKKASSSNW